MKFIADQHTHSNNSPDGRDSVAEMCEKAAKIGLSAIAVTDHCEANRFFSEEYDKSLPHSTEAARNAKEQFKGKIEVLCGVELGQATQDIEQAEKVLSETKFDVVLASMHNLPGMPDFAFIDYKHNDPEPLLGKYFEEIAGLLKWGKFDVLTHLTYPLRYIEGEYGIKIKLEKYKDNIMKIYSMMIKAGKALEINTSGYRQPYGKALPGLWCLELYKKAGGSIITLGSDAHSADDVGANLKDGSELAKAAGFEKFAVYRNRKPEFYSL